MQRQWWKQKSAPCHFAMPKKGSLRCIHKLHLWTWLCISNLYTKQNKKCKTCISWSHFCYPNLYEVRECMGTLVVIPWAINLSLGGWASSLFNVHELKSHYVSTLRTVSKTAAPTALAPINSIFITSQPKIWLLISEAFHLTIFWKHCQFNLIWSE